MNRLTDRELAEIKRRAERACSGPWSVYKADDICENCEDTLEVVQPEVFLSPIVAKLKTEADAEFIAHAREDIPRLIAEVERLRGAVWYAIHHVSNEIYTEEERVKDVQEALLRCVCDTVKCPECRVDILVNPNGHGRCECGSHVKFI
ncbi:hypothetical protein P4631_09240 [Halalkalibacterium halodurans]|uniref:hypothetical protein n=1 Tax=Halalkalibacterium halodurans TaxID=86665 RepID=UPI002E2391B4|nr:hypothetical protein [Halalkalibacterium halodurans]